jgi:hypothetical protein
MRFARILPVSITIAAFALMRTVTPGQTLTSKGNQVGPLFTAFPARTLYSGSTAKPRFKTISDRDYLAPLLAGIALTPNFAGQFRLVQFRMGQGPIGAVVIDSKNGSVFRLPNDIVRDDFFIHNTDCLSAYRWLHRPETAAEEDGSAPLSFKGDSELLIVRQCRTDGRAVTAVERSYYRWHGQRWRLVQRLSAAPPAVL